METKKKKESGYRNGKTVLEELLAMETWDTDIRGNRKKMTMGELMHIKMLKKALNGDINAYREVLDRVEGKAVQKIEEKTEHTFKSTPLSELVSFVKPKSTLEDKQKDMLQLTEGPLGVFSLDKEEQIIKLGGEDAGN